MKTVLTFLCILITASAIPLRAASDTFVDYQNYNHGYCPTCNCYPCRCAELFGDAEEEDPEEEEDDAPGESNGVDPCEPAPVCACNCGISLWAIGLVIGGLATAGVIIVSSNNGPAPHSH